MAFCLLRIFVHRATYRCREKIDGCLTARCCAVCFDLACQPGIEMFLNVFAFNIFIQLMHSHWAQTLLRLLPLCLNYDLLAFIPMTGLGFAVTALVGQQMGAGSIKGAQETAMLSLRVGWSYACYNDDAFYYWC